jgi:hypothetical protein
MKKNGAQRDWADVLSASDNNYRKSGLVGTDRLRIPKFPSAYSTNTRHIHTGVVSLQIRPQGFVLFLPMEAPIHILGTGHVC